MTPAYDLFYDAYHMSELEPILEIRFRNRALLVEALTHRSFKQMDLPHNERLEFFGDSVLKLAVSHMLFTRFPGEPEGILTQKRSNLISDRYLGQIGLEINLGRYLLISESERKGGGSVRLSTLANALEALFGAIYLDQGERVAFKMILHLIEQHQFILTRDDQFFDFKSKLQEFLQQNGCPLPEYSILKESGPDHEKTFFVSGKVLFKSTPIDATGCGASKKEAEQQCAKQLLERCHLTLP